MRIKSNTPLSDNEKRNVFTKYDEATDTAFFGMHEPYEYVYEITPSAK